MTEQLDSQTTMPTEVKSWLGLLPAKETPGPSTFSSWQKQAILYSLEGKNDIEVAAYVNKAPSTVNKFLNTTAAKAAIDDYFNFADREYQKLYIKAVKAINDALEPGEDISVRLSAAKDIVKAHGKPRQKDESRVSAEDIITQIMELKLTKKVIVKKGGG